MTNAVRHCMECRFQRFDARRSSVSSASVKGIIKDPLETILQLTDLMHNDEAADKDEINDLPALLASFIQNPESVLQELDVQRLRAIIYRDVVRSDRSKSGKPAVVVVVIVVLFIHFCFVFFVCFE